MRDQSVDNTPGKAIPKDEQVRRAKKLPLNEDGIRPEKPRNERNADQGKIQASDPTQERERGGKEGNRNLPREARRE